MPTTFQCDDCKKFATMVLWSAHVQACKKQKAQEASASKRGQTAEQARQRELAENPTASERRARELETQERARRGARATNEI